jgi:uncharacterized protein (TIGR04255 family)
VTPIRPKFENPPLIERAITVVFTKLENFSIGDYGLFWSLLRDDFPSSEMAPPVTQELETFEGFKPAPPQVQLLAENALPRTFFRNPEKGELVQLQPDRFSFNWIKTGTDDRYPNSEPLLERFFQLFDQLTVFVAERQLGEIVPVQCELTNVNVIPITDVGETFADVATVIRLPELDRSYGCLRLESQLTASKHLLIDDDERPIGRVHSIAQPAIQADTGDLAFRFDIVARGAPLGPGVQGVKDFLDRAGSAVNAVFLASVTSSGRQFWGETNG